MSRFAHPVLHITIYIRPGCHLCEEAEDLLDSFRDRYALQVTAIDITGDLTLYARYRYEIPVIVTQSGATLGGRIEEPALRSLLAVEAKAATSVQ